MDGNVLEKYILFEPKMQDRISVSQKCCEVGIWIEITATERNENNQKKKNFKENENYVSVEFLGRSFKKQYFKKSRGYRLNKNCDATVFLDVVRKRQRKEKNKKNVGWAAQKPK